MPVPAGPASTGLGFYIVLRPERLAGVFLCGRSSQHRVCMTPRSDRERGCGSALRVARGTIRHGIVLLAVLLVCASVAESRGAARTLLGNSSVEKDRGSAAAGRSRAFSFIARATGTAASEWLFVDSGTRASTAAVALYSNDRGHPGRRLTRGSSRTLRLRAWNSIRLASAKIIRGRRYWLALLGQGGVISFRVRRARRCSSQASTQGPMRSLPVVWRRAARRPTCSVSAFVVASSTGGAHSKSSSPAGSGSTPSTPPATPPSTPPQAPQTNCINAPSACGYPDATNSGVPAGTPLTPRSGNISANTPGQTISNVDLTGGTIVVTANNVTIENSRITAGDSQLNGQSAIDIKHGVTGTKVMYVTMQGSNCNSGALFAGVMNESGDHLLMDHDYGVCLDDILHGSGALLNSYSLDNANIPNDHYEPVADDGGNGSLTVIHDTLLNPHDQTAAVFTQCTFGDVASLDIENNLAGGGDYAFYGPLSDPCSNGGGTETVKNNRLTRLYYPKGGQYGVGVYFTKDVTWSGNYWDDTLQAIPRP